jgi:hypothetical protein
VRGRPGLSSSCGLSPATVPQLDTGANLKHGPKIFSAVGSIEIGLRKISAAPTFCIGRGTAWRQLFWPIDDNYFGRFVTRLMVRLIATFQRILQVVFLPPPAAAR